MRNLVLKIIAGIIGTAISVYFLKGVTYDNNVLTVVYVGATIGLLSFFVKPLLKLITLPLRIITFNLFSIVIIMFLIWIVDCLFQPNIFEITGTINIFYMALINWAAEILFQSNK